MAKSKVEFVNLKKAGLGVAQAAARLAARRHEAGRRVLVLARDPVQAGEIDRMLWTHDPASFVPHALAGGPDAATEPVLISQDAHNPNQAQVLILAHPVEDPPLADFEQLFVLVPAGEGPELNLCRELYRRLSQGDEAEVSHTTKVA